MVLTLIVLKQRALLNCAKPTWNLKRGPFVIIACCPLERAPFQVPPQSCISCCLQIVGFTSISGEA